MPNLNDAYELAPAPTVAERVAAGELTPGEDYDTYPAPGFYDDVADRVLADLFTNGQGSPTIRFWRNEWFHYTGTHWATVHEDEVKRPVRARLRQVTYLKQTTEGETHAPWQPTLAKVREVLEPLKLTVLTPTATEAPTWTGKGRPPAARLIAMANGLFDPATRALHPHTPEWFNLWSLPFNYDPKATAPRWQQFLEEVFAHDPQGADTLQEWAGYLISGRLDLQKMLVIIGVPGAGKSVIDHVLTALMGGAANVAAPSMSKFGEEFQLDQLRGKPLAIFGDAAGEAKSNREAVERIKTITGQGAISVNVKGKPFWTGVLPTRFTIISNQTPKFLDASSAVRRRTLAVELTQSFQHAPDKDLPEKLEKELPGIFLWALAGLDRLNANGGKFTVPATQEEVLEDMEDIGSPLRSFFKENCVITGNSEDIIALPDIYRDYVQWCGVNGLERARLSQNKFRTEVKAMGIAGVKAGQVYATGQKVVRGVQPRPGLFGATEFTPKSA
ncbi:MAG TPA: hypothetical protein H9867_01650 [Candidatus Corynebacterium gallistercoris]|uniref:SF3 helicase domain-containing protein n=1 Tax=Candidatus Corynebacterium gallistercoris TaxID=2838530 RepID=A0A9D1RYV8_9CORY|nr:hypothetical protein [Candidatus Corynebacterium gallistercoris]